MMKRISAKSKKKLYPIHIWRITLRSKSSPSGIRHFTAHIEICIEINSTTYIIPCLEICQLKKTTKHYVMLCICVCVCV